RRRVRVGPRRVEHALAHVAPGGRGVVVAAPGVAAARQQLLRLRVGEGAPDQPAISGIEPDVVEGRTQDAEAVAEIARVAVGIKAGAAEKPDLLDVLAGRAGGIGAP